MSFHLSCPMITAVSVETSIPRVPSRPCQGEAQYSATRMRAPLSGLLASITLVTPLRPHTPSCSTNDLSRNRKKTWSVKYNTLQQFIQNLLRLLVFPVVFFADVEKWNLWHKTCLSAVFLDANSGFYKRIKTEV